MPAVLMHYGFIKDKLGENFIINDTVSLGGQGPDPFFFYGYTLKKRENKIKVREFGSLLHHTDISRIYDFLLTYAYRRGCAEQRILYEFIRGLMYHYCLDRNTHPYIFYISGFTENEKDKAKYAFEHAKIESALDAIYQKDNGEVAIKDALKCPDKELKIISKMFYSLAKDYFKVDYIKPETYFLAVKDMRLVYKILNSPLKIKKILFTSLFAKTMLNALSLPLSIKRIKKYDLFNHAHGKWRNCINGNIRFESLIDLINNAKRDADIVDEIILETKNGVEVLEKIEKFVHEIDHDGFEVNAKKKYFELKMSK